MRCYRDAKSPWGEGIWYDDREFAEIMDELRERAGHDIFVQGEGVDVEAMLLRLYGLSPDVRDLGEDVLGRTIFHRDGRLELEISRDLTNEAEASTVGRRRLRSTLAHECAHIALHRHLYVLDESKPLFPEMSSKPPGFLCRVTAIDDKGRFASTREWWEYQANRGMASLLLPRGLIRDHLSRILDEQGFDNMNGALKSGEGATVIQEVMAVFDTSFEMTLYRLQDLGFIPKHAGQIELAFTEREG